MVLRITFATTLTMTCGFLISIYVLLNFHQEGMAIALGATCSIVGIIAARLGMQKLRDKNKFTYVLKHSTEVLYQGTANHFVGVQQVNGTLYLLKDKLVFQTGFFRSRLKHESIIQLSAIKEVSFAKTHKVYDKIIVIVTDMGEERFLVSGNQLWIDEIENAIHHNSLSGKQMINKAG